MDADVFRVVETPNNGSFQWQRYTFEHGYDDALENGTTASGCNFTIRLKVWAEVAYSNYFTIITYNDDIPSPGNGTPNGSGTVEPTGQPTPGKSSGVSTTTLAVAVAVPIVALIAMFAAVLFFGIRKDWFVRRKYAVAQGNDADLGALPSRGPAEKRQDTMGAAPIGDWYHTKLHAQDMPYQMDRVQRHEVPGDEGRRQW
ncbi:hypothetical protein H2203_007941 [Taxawa tesnikishii (nom. ined.)]|nr:hypothetical protein H2203_007941 [Dothideales sp. JES 119]